MAFKEIDQRLIDECVNVPVDFEKVKELIAEGADINAFDEEYEVSLCEQLLNYYMEIEEGRDLSNLYKIIELFLEKGLILNPKPDDCDYFIPYWFRHLPPEKICVDIFKMLLERGTYSLGDLDNIISDATLDLHLDQFYYYEGTQYSEEDSKNYFSELAYWACAYNVKRYPEKCSEDLFKINWFEREKNKVEFVCENRSSGVFVEDLETHERIEIDGWSSKY